MENNSWKFIAACCDAGLRKRKEEEEEKTDQLADRTWVKWKTRVGTGSTSISTARRIPSLEKEEEEDGRFSYTPVWEQKFVGRPPIIMVDANYLQPLFFPSLLLVDKFMKSRFEGKISLTLTRICSKWWFELFKLNPGRYTLSFWRNSRLPSPFAEKKWRDWPWFLVEQVHLEILGVSLPSLLHFKVARRWKGKKEKTCVHQCVLFDPLTFLQRVYI